MKTVKRLGLTNRDLHLLAQAIHAQALSSAIVNLGGSEIVAVRLAVDREKYSAAWATETVELRPDSPLSERYEAQVRHRIALAATYGPTKGMSVEDQDRLWSAVGKLEAVGLATTFKDPAGGGE